jgi:hypothetical protein
MPKEFGDAVVDCGGFLEFIPGGYTKGVYNKPFKDHVLFGTPTTSGS